MWSISSRVNDPKKDDEALLEPIKPPNSALSVPMQNCRYGVNEVH
jgi:hypothetical protein